MAKKMNGSGRSVLSGGSDGGEMKLVAKVAGGPVDAKTKVPSPGKRPSDQ